MSTKTISKRVALATVVALGAGVLSLVSVSSASAVDKNTAIGVTNSSASNPAIAVTNTLYIASYNSTTGTAVALPEGIIASPFTAGIQNGAAIPASVGLLSVGDVAGNSAPIAGTTQTATLLAGGKLSVYEQTSSATNKDSIVVSGATIALPASATHMTLNNTSTAVQNITAANNTTFGAVITPNTGVSSFTVALYTGNTGSGTNYATTGTLSGYITVSIASASTSGTVSATKSGIFYNAPLNGTFAATTGDSSASGVGTSAYNVTQGASIVAKDAYGVYLATGSVFSATATNGAYLTLTEATAAASVTGTSSTAFATMGATPQSWGLTVADPTNAPLSTTVTVSINGVVIGTKAFTFTGEVTKVVLSGPSNGATSSPSTGSATIQFLDAAGNSVYPVASDKSYPQTVVKDAAITGLGIGYGSTAYPTSSAAGSAYFTCGSTNATGNFAVDYVNASGTVIASNAVPVSCSGAPTAYTAKFDKSTYNSGDLATLTVTFKDSLGALAGDFASTKIAGSGTSLPNIFGSNLSPSNGATTNAATATDNTTNGVVKYKFIVGATSGSYQAIVDFPAIDTASATIGGSQAALSVPYTIASSGTSLNDVLKGIVSLIASINKQIAALAKLVTKK